MLVPATVGVTAGVVGVSAVGIAGASVLGVVGVAEASVPGAAGVVGTSAGSFTAVALEFSRGGFPGVPTLAGIGNSGAGFSGLDGAVFSLFDSGNLPSFNFDKSKFRVYHYTRFNQAGFKFF